MFKLTLHAASSAPPATLQYRLSGASANHSGDTPLASARYQKLADDMTGQFTGVTVDSFLELFLPLDDAQLPEAKVLEFSEAAPNSEQAWVSTL